MLQHVGATFVSDGSECKLNITRHHGKDHKVVKEADQVNEEASTHQQVIYDPHNRKSAARNVSTRQKRIGLRDYDFFKEIKELSGVGVCPTTGKLTFPDDVWS
ncbi:hypothetical protein F442_03277 [Phytophthora nicotianae P10297]|uniref:Uncharacterized protein n=1 Tax=Phytophthora nicotianae P10297 TaxID=1317064 RepID=W2ZXC4_PHYNI|nr:hypothetical protein F442_03277 [Phytophthora nicotianae P10297]